VTLFWVIGAVVFGLLMFLMIRRRLKKAERDAEIQDKLKDVKLTCVKCKTEYAAAPAFRRSGLRGYLCVCPHCGARAWI
jgi:hypothetical protein